MIDVCLLGTGGMMPLPYRYLTSLMIRYNGRSILVDCGEGTQIALRKVGWSPNPVDVICFTHFHADHISGLPGMLLTMGNAERTEPLLLIGPKGLEKVVKSLRVIAPELPFDIACHEIDGTEESFTFNGMPDFRMEAFRVNHNVTCYGYDFKLFRKGRFNVDNAEKLGVPRPFWGRLQNGDTVTLEDGSVITPDMVLGEARTGIHFTYATDTRPVKSITEHAEGADLLICEGMYGEADKLAKAKDKKHMTFAEAAEIARAAGVKEMWLTHYSPSLQNPKEYMKDTKQIFANTVAAKDGRMVTLTFPKE